MRGRSGQRGRRGSSGRSGQRGADRAQVQRAALGVGLTVGLASAAILGVVVAIAVIVLVTSSRVVPPAQQPHGRGGHRPWDDRVVELGDVVPELVILGIVGALALAAIAWYASRRAVRPLEHALAVQRAFVADASHELRTPLTTLTSRVQLAQVRAERGGDVEEALTSLRRDADVLDGVLTDLLVAAETAADRPRPHAHAGVGPTVDSAIAITEPGAREREVQLVRHLERGLVVAADGTAVTRALVALLDNAVRHAPPGSEVTVAARRAGPWAEIRVIDQGSGIVGVSSETLFGRFERAVGDDGAGDAGVARRGFGLGLALVRDIAARFDGDVQVERTSPAGTTFLLRLPVQ